MIIQSESVETSFDKLLSLYIKVIKIISAIIGSNLHAEGEIPNNCVGEEQ